MKLLSRLGLGLAVIALQVTVAGVGSVFAAGSGTHPVDYPGTLSSQQIAAGLAAQTRVNAALSHSSSSRQISPNVSTNAYYEDMAIQYQEQDYYYWCGPAAVSEAVGFLGNPQSQATLASYMGTTTAGTKMGEITQAMDHYAPAYNYQSLATPDAGGSISWSTFDTDWNNDMYYDIVQLQNRPVIQSAEIGPDTYYLAGYSSSNTPQDIYHYLTSDGLQNGYAAGYEANYDDSNDVQTSALGNWWWTAGQVAYDAYGGGGIVFAPQ